MESQNKTELENRVKDYLLKSALHLFETKYHDEGDAIYKHRLFQVQSFKVNDKLISLTTRFENNKIFVDEILDTSYIRTKNDLGMFKNRIFPQYIKHRAIKWSCNDKIKYEFWRVSHKMFLFTLDSKLHTLDEIKLELNRLIANANENILLILKATSNDNK